MFPTTIYDWVKHYVMWITEQERKDTDFVKCNFLFKCANVKFIYEKEYKAYKVLFTKFYWAWIEK